MAKKIYGPRIKTFIPQNPQKWKFNKTITSRSNMELHFMRWADLSSSVIEVGSENAIVSYKDPTTINTDGTPKTRRYYIDFYILIKKSDGTTKKYFIEIKPEIETLQPKRGKKSAKVFNEQCITYAKNCAKWKAAIKFAQQKNAKFLLLTEKNVKPM